MRDVIEPESGSAPEAYWDFDGLSVFDALEAKATYVLSGKNGSQVKLSGSACYLLQAVHSGMSFGQLAQKLNERYGEKQTSEDELSNKYEALLADLSSIAARDARKELPWGFWLRCRLIPECFVTRITSITAFLYHPAAVAFCVAIMLAAVAVVMYGGFSVTFHNRSILPAYLLFALVLLVHEFGHASACARYGARPSDIGFLTYLIYPAFYSDVSAAWKLSRFQRVIVDLGGCYFQGIISAVLLFVSYSTGWEPLRLAVILSLYSALFSLNPIFKFDGYWVLADCLGVPNLSRQPGRIGKYLFSRIRRHPVEPLPWPSWVIHVLMAYSGIVIAVWTFFAFRLLPMLILELRLIRHTGAAMVRQLMAGRLPAWQDVATALYASALLLLITVTLWNIVRQPVRSVFLRVRRVIQRTVKGHIVETIHGSMPRLPGQLENFVSPAGQRQSPASNNTGGRSKTEAAR